MKKVIAACLIGLWAFSLPVAAEEKVFSVSSIHIDRVQKARIIFDDMKTPEAQAALSAAAAWFGVDPTYVVAGINLLPSTRNEGESSFFDIGVPDGYVFCGAYIGVVSMTGQSQISARTRDRALSIQTVTPQKQSIDGGNNWVEADASVYGVLPQYLSKYRASGHCVPPTNEQALILECKKTTNCPPVTVGKAGAGLP